MAEKPIVLIAQFKAKQDKIDELKNTLISLIEPTRSEPGCVFYHLHQDQNDPAHFVFYESFKGQSAFDTHVDSSYIKAFFERADELLAKPHEVTFLDKLA